VARRIPILAKLLGAYLVPTVATFAGFGALAHWVARRSLEEELGRRLTSVAAAAASQIGDENVAQLVPGDESTRTYRNLKRRLSELEAAAGVARIYVFDPDGKSRCDTRDLPIGERYYRLDADRSELRAVFSGAPKASVLFRGRDGMLYKSGYAPLRSPDAPEAPIQFAVGVDGAASLYEQLAGFRRTLVAVGAGGTLAVVALSVLVARLLTRPVKRLERAAARIGQGELDQPVVVPSRDEIGLVAETLEAMRQQLRSRDERMQMMLAGIAHEVRNPLGGMELYAGLLREDLGSDAEKLEHVRKIERELDRLKTIVSDFLEYARRPKPVLKAADLSELLSEVRDLTLASATPRKVEVTLEAVPARAACDSGQLRRALLNLAQNAVQACPTDGSGRVRLGVQRAGGEVVVTIGDTGPGIDPQTLDKIWTPFYTTKQQGTGLGLAFVRDIVLDHGARIDVASQTLGPGHGTTFTLALPEAA
jgi:signal transduction histidine kinase